MSREIIDKIDKILSDDVVGRHSFFQLQHFVVNNQPTIQSKMWQCIRELRTKSDVLRQIDLEIEETRDSLLLLDLEVKRLELFIPTELVDLATQEKEIKKRQLARRKEAGESSLRQLERKYQETSEECQFFLKSMEALQKIEPLKPFDDPEAQRQYWNEKLSQELNIRMLLKQPINVELAKTILSLNDDAPIKKQLINMVEQTQRLELSVRKQIS